MGRETRQALVTSVILAAVLLAFACALGVVAGSQQMASIQSTTIEGEDVLALDDSNTSLWTNGSYALTVSVSARENPYEVCMQGVVPGESSCRYVRLDNGTRSVTLTEFPWDNTTTGRYTLNVTVGTAGSSQVHDYVEREIRLLDPLGDPDDDGLTNREEIERGTNMTLQDTDRDGLDDNAELFNYGTDPTSVDTDDDDLTDAREINGRTDPTDPDTDDDRLTDGREANDVGTDPTVADTDEDGIPDGQEVEQYDTDPRDPDTDGDGVPDGQEIADPDADPTDPDRPDDAMTEDIPGLLPAPIGNSLLVLVAVALVGAAAATGISIARDGHLRESLPFPNVEAFEVWAGAEEAAGTGGETEPTGPDDDDPATGEPETPATPILTDEERVLQMLHENGGQIKQKRIVADTEWSKSKVSRLLSRMAENDEIRKITLGRENVIRLPDADDEHDSPLGDAADRDRS